MYNAPAKYWDNVPSDEPDGLDQGSSTFDLREVYAAVYRSRYVIIAIIAACVLIGIAVTLLSTRKYEGVASVEVRQEAEKVLGTEQDREGVATKIDIERFLDTQIDLVRSRRVTIAVAEELGLFRNDGFLQAMGIEPEYEASALLSEQEARREAVIETLLRNVEVSYTGQTRILEIRFLSPDARLSAKIANAFATNYIISNLQRKSETSSYARDFLRRQLQEAQVRLEETERGALNYARQARIVDASNAARPSGGNTGNENAQPQSLVTAQLVQLNQSYSDAVSQRVEAEQRWRRVASSTPLSVTEVLANQAIQSLLERRAIAEADYREQLRTRKEDYPTVIQAQARLNETNRQLSAIANNIRQSVQSQYDIALRREQQLLAQIEQLKGRTLVEQNQSIQLSILRREADTNRQQYETLLRRYNQLTAEAGVQSNNLAIVDRATPNVDPAWPKVPLNMALALFAGLLLAGLYVLVQMQLLDKIRTTYDVTERLGVPMLGAIPVSQDVIGDIGDPKSEVSEAFNLIRTGLSLSREGGAPRTAMVTSVQASEGKTSCCVSLALGFSRLGKRVLVIDLDLRRPNVHRLLKLKNSVGASSVLSGQVPVLEAIQRTSYEGVDALTGGPISPSPTDLIMGQHLLSTIAQMEKNYDLLLIDSPPVLALADAEILSSRVEATVFVIESGRNSRKAIQNALRRVVNNGAKLAGVVLTKYDPGQLGYGYNSDYAYNYKYGQREKADA